MLKSILCLGVILSFSAHAQFRRQRGNLCTKNTAAMVADGILTVDVFLGYYDNSPHDFVVNFMERSQIVRALTGTCDGGALCEFVLDRTNSQRFSKSILRNGRPVIVEIIIHNSAVLEFTSYNHTPRQRELSQRTDVAFVDRLKSGDAVYYLGHSRYGGGPDFHVPVMDQSWNVDADYYRREKPGVKLLEIALRGGGAKLYGAFSCDSIDYFSRLVRGAAPGTLFIGTTLEEPTYDDNMAAFLMALENTVGGNCDFNDDFIRSNLPARLVRNR